MLKVMKRVSPVYKRQAKTNNVFYPDICSTSYWSNYKRLVVRIGLDFYLILLNFDRSNIYEF